MKKNLIAVIILLGTVISCQPNDSQESEMDQKEEETGGCAQCKP